MPLLPLRAAASSMNSAAGLRISCAVTRPFVLDAPPRARAPPAAARIANPSRISSTPFALSNDLLPLDRRRTWNGWEAQRSGTRPAFGQSTFGAPHHQLLLKDCRKEQQEENSIRTSGTAWFARFTPSCQSGPQ
nr:uncharacterized protein LOC109771787 isoform X3 [Aegilops tauschii subsp. strangulata]